MSNVLQFVPRRKQSPAPAVQTIDAGRREVSPSREVVEWCLMILQQTDETDLRIPLSRSFSHNTLYEVILEFAPAWIVTTDGPAALRFRLR